MSETELLESQIRECYGRIVYTHKTHEKCADLYLQHQLRMKWTQIVLSAFVTGGALGTIFGEFEYVALITAVLSTLLLCVNTYAKNHDLGELVQKHRQAGASLWLIRERYLSLLTDIRVGDQTVESIREKRDELMEQAHSIYVKVPRTIHKSYEEARKALQIKEELSFTDAEIDRILPSSLRRSNAKSEESGHE